MTRTDIPELELTWTQEAGRSLINRLPLLVAGLLVAMWLAQ